MNRMLIFILFFSVASLLALKPADETAVNLEQAVKNGQVTCAANVNDGSIHYIKPLTVTVKNIRNYYATNYKTSMHGSFNYDFFDTSFVTIGMFNIDNIIVRELYRNPKEPPGKHKLEYKFDATEYTDNFYYPRLIADGEIILNGKIDNRNNFDSN